MGLVGFGSGGRLFHAPLIDGADGCELAGVVTSSPERQAEVRELGVPAFETLADLLESGAVDAVTISTPAATHVSLVQQAIAAGVPVVSDKPFALDRTSAREAVEAAEAAGVLLSVYQNRRWDSDFRTLQSLVDAGRLGEVLRFESRFERLSAPDKPVGLAGGGLLLDFGAHLVDQALVLLGPAVTVYAEVSTRTDAPQPRAGRHPLEDDWFIALEHESGARSHLAGSWWHPAPGPRFRVVGTQAAYVVRELMDGQESALKAGFSPVDVPGWLEEPEMAWGRLQYGGAVEIVPSERGRWDLFYELWGAAVRGQGPVPVDPWDAVRALEVIDAARLSAAQGRVVRL
ncbi:Gfo/Idh/MocA family oxidoreductase [Spongisporangium articulatum]|uniref:Gfo/Idh/MocA family oxidoreductase n=1 Tax=Spongisporangium articulatum TaxID=3362603 RepID=A0ABW8AJ73_9ACTN